MAFTPFQQHLIITVLDPGGGAVSALDYSSGEIGCVGYTIVAVTFTATVFSPTADYVSGSTIEVNAVGATISSADLQGDNKTIHFTLSTNVDLNDVITYEYDDDFGDLEDSEAVPLGDIATQTTTNFVGTTWFFNEEESTGQLFFIWD